jgi:hypothetical protein
MEVVMTTQEHELMIAMLAKQRRFIDVLLNVLIDKGVITKENRPAFESSVQADSVQSGAMYQETKSSYLQAAQAYGVEVDL